MSAKSNKSKDKNAPTAVNKKAYRNYELIEKFEAGLALLGTEVKSMRNGNVDLSGSYAKIINNQCYLVAASIAQYEQASAANHEPTRNRKLLLHAAQIKKIKTKLLQRGFTLVPLRVYFNNRGLAKIELALAKGKKQYDKRDTITERRQKKDISRNMKKYR